MEKFILASILSVALVSGCAKVEDEKSKEIDTISEVGGGDIATVEENGQVKKITGTGWARFSKTMPTTSDSMGINLTARLITDGSSVSVVYYASRMDMSNGIEVRFVRFGSNVRGYVYINGSATAIQVNPANTAPFDPENLNLNIDLHAVPTAARLFTWVDHQEEKVISTAAIDSGRTGDLNANLDHFVLEGLYLGIKIKQSEISRSQLASPHQARTEVAIPR